MDFLIFTAIQFILFVPFFIIWKNDCKEFGKDNLGVSLGKRFLAWIILCPIWMIPFLIDKK